MNRRGFLQLFAAAAIAPAAPKPAPLPAPPPEGFGIRCGPGAKIWDLPPLHINCRSTIITRRAP